MAIQSSMFPGKTKDDFDVGRRTVSIDAASISALLQPSGVQRVQEVNRERPNVTINQSVSISGVLDPKASASTAMSEISSKVLVAMEAAHTDGIDM